MFVKNLPPVPEGFDPDTVQFGVPPQGADHAYLHCDGIWCRILDRHWYQSSQSSSRRIYCLKFKLWYPPEWYDSNGDLLPDVYEYDNKSNKWPDNIGPLDEIEALSNYQRINKEKPHKGYKPNEVLSWSLVAYRVVKRHKQSQGPYQKS